MYAVETLIGEEWENVWTDDNHDPVIFETREEAEASLDDHLKECQDAFREGFLSTPPDLKLFRIMEG